jgi:hypothetical protein
MAMLPTMLEADRKREGWWVGRAAWRLGMSIREYRELEASERWPKEGTWGRIFEVFGWNRNFAGRG